MIKNIFYTENMTYIKDERNNEITTNNLSFSQSFDFAKINNVEFDYEMINKEDEEDFSHYLEYAISSHRNTNISYFFNLLEENGIRKIIDNDDLFGRKGVRQTISKIIDDYNSEIALYNLEYYGTDTYIAQVLYEHLMIYNNTNKNAKVYALFKLVDNDEYDLNIFLDVLKEFTADNDDEDTKLLKQLKNDFNNSYNYSSEALEDYIKYLSTYGGDYNYQIVEAMNKCFDDIIKNKPFCDRNGLIEELKNNKW